MNCRHLGGLRRHGHSNRTVPAVFTALLMLVGLVGIVTARPAPASAQARTCSDPAAEFEVVYRDDFNGSTLNPNWRVYNAIGHRGNGIRRPEAITVSEGNLVITASGATGETVSGGMFHDYNQTYGRYRVRVRTDYDPSDTMAGVVLTWPTSNRIPRDGENEFYTTGYLNGATRRPFRSMILRPDPVVAEDFIVVHDADASLWQVMTLEWTPDEIRIIRQADTVDAEQQVTVLTETDADLISDASHRLTIQLDAFRAETLPADVSINVDWVEVSAYCDPPAPEGFACSFADGLLRWTDAGAAQYYIFATDGGVRRYLGGHSGSGLTTTAADSWQVTYWTGPTPTRATCDAPAPEGFACSFADGLLRWTDAGAAQYYIFATDGGVRRYLGGHSGSGLTTTAADSWQVTYWTGPTPTRATCDAL